MFNYAQRALILCSFRSGHETVLAGCRLYSRLSQLQPVSIPVLTSWAGLFWDVCSSEPWHNQSAFSHSPACCVHTNSRLDVSRLTMETCPNGSQCHSEMEAKTRLNYTDSPKEQLHSVANGFSSAALNHPSVDKDTRMEMMFGDGTDQPAFRAQKILILTKLSRYEFEKRLHPQMSDAELHEILKQRGSDFGRLLDKHKIHRNYVETIAKELEAHHVETKIVQRWDYTKENIEWADAIFSAGGDGTFLLAASKIRDRNKPVIGINTDPESSEGYMCLMNKKPFSHFKTALEDLLSGRFKWLYRQRIRVTLSGNSAFEQPIELHDQQLMYPEYRWSEHIREHEEARHRSNSKVCDKAGHCCSVSEDTREEEMNILPYLALNEVFIGESLSSRVSYYTLGVDGGEKVKQKSSGITVCTGTGSTSWYFNINKLTEESISELMAIMNQELNVNLPATDMATVTRIAHHFNSQLLFNPSDLKMAYTVRDPVFNATFPAFPHRGFCRDVDIRSRCYDAHLVIDGGLSYIFNDGARAKLQILQEDALRTVVFR